MKKLLGLSVILLVGCGGASDRPSGTAGGAIMQQQPASYWIQELKNPDAEKRKFATTLLRDHARTDLGVREELLEALKNEDPEIRVGAANVFGAMSWDGRDAMETLKKMYLDKDDRVSKAAVEAIRQIDERELPQIGVSRGQIAK